VLRKLLCSLAGGAAVFVSAAVDAHDPSAYGGLFRSRDFGQTWLNADTGLFLGGAVSLAVDPVDPNHLLLGTDTGLLSSANGGRSWARAEPGKLFGAVFALTFLADGRSAICVTPGGVFRLENGEWKQAGAAAAAAPARDIALGDRPERLYLVGRRALFRSDDAGRQWSEVVHGLDDQPEFTEIAVAMQPQETLYAIVGERLMASLDQGQSWRPRDNGLPRQKLEALSIDARHPSRLWVASADRIYTSDDAGMNWKPFGQPLPEAGTSVRGVAADTGEGVVVAITHRGLYRSTDRAATWTMLEGNLPVHLEGRPLVRDPSSASTLYVGFALMPYGEIWRRAVEGGNLLNQVDAVSLAGGAAFLLLVGLLGIFAARWLAARRRSSADNVSGVTR
jgi:photosystem II stability/assembly factor-like uncharacterized protein